MTFTEGLGATQVAPVWTTSSSFRGYDPVPAADSIVPNAGIGSPPSAPPLIDEALTNRTNSPRESITVE